MDHPKFIALTQKEDSIRAWRVKDASHLAEIFRAVL